MPPEETGMKTKSKLIKVLAVPALVGVALVLPTSAVAATSAHSTIAPASSTFAAHPVMVDMKHMVTHCSGGDGT